MKPLSSLLVLAAVMLTPILVRATEQLPVSTRSATAKPVQLRDPKLWRLVADGARVKVGAAQLKLEVAARRFGITMSLAL